MPRNEAVLWLWHREVRREMRMTAFPYSNGQFFTSEDMPALNPNPFCESLPLQYKFHDNTVWQSAQHCWRAYWNKFVRGLRPKPAPGGIASAHLTFGALVHEGSDVWMKAVALGCQPEQATEFALAHVLEASWPAGQEHDVFGGTYGPVFQCSDRTRTNSKKGIHRCEWSYKEHLLPSDSDGEPLGVCPGCGGPIEARVAYLCSEKVKNRRTLARTIVALGDALAAGALRAKVLPDGRIGSELRWFRPLQLISPDGDPYQMTGSWDGAAEIGTAGRTVLPELKTTQREPNDAFWQALEMSPQVHTYSWAGVAQFGPGTRCLLIAIHVGSGFTEIYQKPVYFSPSQLAEWEADLGSVIQEAEIRARLALELEHSGEDPSAAYPRRLSACHSLPGAPTTPCPFRDFCGLPPEDRESFLAANFVVEPWNPVAAKQLTGHEPPA